MELGKKCGATTRYTFPVCSTCIQLFFTIGLQIFILTKSLKPKVNSPTKNYMKRKGTVAAGSRRKTFFFFFFFLDKYLLWEGSAPE